MGVAKPVTAEHERCRTRIVALNCGLGQYPLRYPLPVDLARPARRKGSPAPAPRLKLLDRTSTATGHRSGDTRALTVVHRARNADEDDPLDPSGPQSGQPLAQGRATVLGVPWEAEAAS